MNNLNRAEGRASGAELQGGSSTDANRTSMPLAVKETFVRNLWYRPCAWSTPVPATVKHQLQSYLRGDRDWEAADRSLEDLHLALVKAYAEAAALEIPTEAPGTCGEQHQEAHGCAPSDLSSDRRCSLSDIYSFDATHQNLQDATNLRAPPAEWNLVEELEAMYLWEQEEIARRLEMVKIAEAARVEQEAVLAVLAASLADSDSHIWETERARCEMHACSRPQRLSTRKDA